jgi:hypothetical protein
MADNDLARQELEHCPVTGLRYEVAEEVEGLAEVAALAPHHRVWAERKPGLDRLTYVAQRRKGTNANPYLVVTKDLAELRDALRPQSG